MLKSSLGMGECPLPTRRPPLRHTVKERRAAAEKDTKCDVRSRDDNCASRKGGPINEFRPEESGITAKRQKLRKLICLACSSWTLSPISTHQVQDRPEPALCCAPGDGTREPVSAPTGKL